MLSAVSFSIVDGEFVATTKSQNDVLRGEIVLERRHIQTNRRDEMYKVSSLLSWTRIANQQQGPKQELLTFDDNSPDALL